MNQIIERPHTLSSIAAGDGVSKDTVTKRWQRARKTHGDLGKIVNGARRFTNAEKVVLDGYKADPRQPETPQVSEGNHQRPVDLSVSHTASLETFRTARERAIVTNGQEFMLGLEGLLSTIEQKMDDAEEAQEAQLIEIRSIKKKAQKRIAGFRQRSTEHRLKTDLIGLITNQEVGDVQEIAEEMGDL
jgi:hypothetical protein